MWFYSDWRGLAHLVGFKIEKIPVIACDADPTARVLTLWQKQDVPCNVKKLQEFLEQLDRFDVLDDAADSIGIIFFVLLRFVHTMLRICKRSFVFSPEMCKLTIETVENFL